MKGVLKFEEKKRFLEANLMQGYKNGKASGIFAEDTEVDTEEQSALKLRAQQQSQR
ncbi:hypothetical protein PIB30_059075 [Stylosanthes scabra]|uniref:Uncharacterized protein n=1 Tax=Stylosanthes scabra TaxID=79078 RepID=A0ABU6SK48_9FABA|nr:hypothetical protein [Stylosanthes scabra]